MYRCRPVGIARSMDRWMCDCVAPPGAGPGFRRPSGRSDLRQFGGKALSKDFGGCEIVELLVEHVAPALEETDIAQSQVQRFASAPAGLVDPAVHLVVLHVRGPEPPRREGMRF